jgi:hypothetical protein
MSSAVEREPSPQEMPGGDRVREHTDPELQTAIDRELRARVERYRRAGSGELSRRIRELEAESDMERVLETNASVLALAGLLAGVFVHRRFLVVPGIVLAFLLQHARQGWCPPLPLFRRLGVRTRQEIDAERYALKALRGDLDESCSRAGDEGRTGPW